jgi:hypothetical protein
MSTYLRTVDVLYCDFTARNSTFLIYEKYSKAPTIT